MRYGSRACLGTDGKVSKHDTVDIPASNMKKAIAQILLDEGYIKNFQTINDGTQGVIRITLKYVQPGKEKVITGLRFSFKSLGRVTCTSAPSCLMIMLGWNCWVRVPLGPFTVAPA